MRYCPYCEADTAVEEIVRNETYTVRGEKIGVRARVLVCKGCGNDLFDPEREEETLRAVYNGYRRRRGLLTSDEIRQLRRSYGLSQRQLARLLGWGIVTIQRYEKGAVQDVAHDLLLRQLKDPQFVLSLVDSPRADLSPRERKAIRARITEQLGGKSVGVFAAAVEQMVRADCRNNPLRSGFRTFDLARFGRVVQAILSLLGGKAFKTKLAKLLWLSDFLYFAENSLSITGAVYARLPHGPAPHHFPAILASLEELGIIETWSEEVGEYVGDMVRAVNVPEEKALGLDEYSAIERVVQRYGHLSATALSTLSHRESAWVERNNGDVIPYSAALDMDVIRGLCSPHHGM